MDTHSDTDTHTGADDDTDRIRRAVSTDGTEIARRVYGHRPPLVLLHGAPQDGDLAWEALVPEDEMAPLDADYGHRTGRHVLRALPVLAVAALALALAGCGNDDTAVAIDDTAVAAPTGVDEDELLEMFEPRPAPPLDLDTRQASFAAGDLTAAPWDDTYVGRVTDELFIGVRAAPTADDVTVYLCDDDLSLLLDGSLDGGSGSLSNDRAQIDLEVADDTVTGTVSLDGEDEVSFTASAAVGNAGVYVAEGEVGEFEAVARWIVLDDGEQRGGVEQCFRNPWTGEKICRRL